MLAFLLGVVDSGLPPFYTILESEFLVFDNVGKNLDEEANKRTAKSFVYTVFLVGSTVGLFLGARDTGACFGCSLLCLVAAGSRMLARGLLTPLGSPAVDQREGRGRGRKPLVEHLQ